MIRVNLRVRQHLSDALQLINGHNLFHYQNKISYISRMNQSDRDFIVYWTIQIILNRERNISVLNVKIRVGNAINADVSWPLKEK